MEEHMEFENLVDAKNLMRCIANRLPHDNKYYDDFLFFGSVNFTTSSEYREELKRFLENFIIDNGVTFLSEAAIKLYPSMVRLYGWL